MKRWLIAVFLFAPGCNTYHSWRNTTGVAPPYANSPGAGSAFMSSNPDLDGRMDTRRSIFRQP